MHGLSKRATTMDQQRGEALQRVLNVQSLELDDF
jgi:hypothetical protein